VACVEDVLEGLEDHSSVLTAGSINGLFLAVKGQHVREIKCIAAGAPYFEWENYLASYNGRK